MTALTASLNTKAAILSRVRAGRVLAWAPFLILSVRLLLALLAQGLVAATPQPPRAIMGGLPVWGTLYSLLIWPSLWGIAEEMTYQGYALPRLEVLTGQTWLAVVMVTVGFGLQHIALPSILDGRYMLWRFLPSLLLGLFNAVVYLLIRRLLPLIIGHWAANALSVLTLAVLPMLQ